MTEVVVCSGKGGTGKTSVVAGIAALGGHVVLADCDVDAANLHLVLAPVRERTEPFIAGHVARIRAEDCDGCGLCHDLCRFGAVEFRGETTCRVDPVRCEGCGVCVHFCPREAIDFNAERCGEWGISRTRFGPLVHARLDVGAENSGKLVTTVREEARRLARAGGHGLVLVDGPPGIGCPATAALTGADLTLLVTEPSLAGLHDLARVLDLTDHFGVEPVVCINKHDLSPRLTGSVEEYCAERGVDIVGRIPYEPRMDAAQLAGLSLVEHAPDCAAARAITSTWRAVEQRLAAAAPRKE